MPSFFVREIIASDKSTLDRELDKLSVEPAGKYFMRPKGKFYLLKASGIISPAGNILKQEMLSLGADCATARGVVACEIDRSDVLMMGTEKQFSRLIPKLKKQPFQLKELAREIEQIIQPQKHWQSFLLKDGRRFDLSEKPAIMGILNVTPDSFSDGGRHLDTECAIQRGIEMEKHGADIIDIGGESTRPGAKEISVIDEKNRILPVIEGLAGKISVPISVDTRKSEVAKAAIQTGADLVNDVSAMTFDSKMVEVVKDFNVPVILMHHLGNPQTMQNNPIYLDVIQEIFEFLSERIEFCLESGIDAEKIIVDPGIGFGKRLEDNLRIIRNLREFHSLRKPMLLGVSRKSFIGKIMNTDVKNRMEGSLTAAVIGVQNGAHILRVHDVLETKIAVSVANEIFRVKDPE
ncbi:MAG: dihydropteroate synthase [Candidatus Marinimicrobia bacterium]|nr:dihydropteroate synthase [Candidatus Neomarinimicrobiota bacterium]